MTTVDNRVELSEADNTHERSEGGSGGMDVLQGTLDLLILKVLAAGPQHGWAVAQRIRERSESLLQVNQGSLYPALHRLEDEGWIAGSWAKSETQRRVKEYRLTRAGRKRLGTERDAWRTYARAVDLILDER